MCIIQMMGGDFSPPSQDLNSGHNLIMAFDLQQNCLGRRATGCDLVV